MDSTAMGRAVAGKVAVGDRERTVAAVEVAGAKDGSAKTGRTIPGKRAVVDRKRAGVIADTAAL